MKARDARRKQDLHQIRTALNLYYNDKGYLPHTSNYSLGFGKRIKTQCLNVSLDEEDGSCVQILW